MANYLLKESFDEVVRVHSKILRHDVSVSQSAKYELGPDDAHRALSIHTDIWLNRGYCNPWGMKRFDDGSLLTKHSSEDVFLFVVVTLAKPWSTEVGMPGDAYDLLFDVD